MTNDKNNTGISPVGAALAGAAVGAVVGAGAAALTVKENRDMVAKKFEEIKETGEEVYTAVKNTVAGAVDEVKDQVDEAK